MQVKCGLRLKNSSHKCLLEAVFIGYYKQYWPGGFLCPGAPKGSTGRLFLILKRLRRRGHSLKSHPTDKKLLVAFLGIFDLMFDFILYVPSTIFQLYRDGSSWVEPVLN